MPTHLGDALATALLDGTAQTDELRAAVARAVASAEVAAADLRAARRAARDGLSALRVAAGHSQESLGFAAGVGRRSIVVAESGGSMDLATLAAIVRGLDVSPTSVAVRPDRTATREELRSIADDPTTPKPVRRRALAILRRREVRSGDIS